VRFAGVMRYALIVFVIPIGFLVSMGVGEWAYWIYLIGALIIYVFASSLSATLFPLEIRRYESSVTELNITK